MVSFGTFLTWLPVLWWKTLSIYVTKTKEPVGDSGTLLVISQTVSLVWEEQGRPFCVGLVLFALSYLCLVISAAGYKFNCPRGVGEALYGFWRNTPQTQLSQLVRVCCPDQFQELKFQITVAGECYSSLVGDGKRKWSSWARFLFYSITVFTTTATQTLDQPNPAEVMRFIPAEDAPFIHSRAAIAFGG